MGLRTSAELPAPAVEERSQQEQKQQQQPWPAHSSPQAPACIAALLPTCAAVGEDGVIGSSAAGTSTASTPPPTDAQTCACHSATNSVSSASSISSALSTASASPAAAAVTQTAVPCESAVEHPPVSLCRALTRSSTCIDLVAARRGEVEVVSRRRSSLTIKGSIGSAVAAASAAAAAATSQRASVRSTQPRRRSSVVGLQPHERISPLDLSEDGVLVSSHASPLPPPHSASPCCSSASSAAHLSAPLQHCACPDPLSPLLPRGRHRVHARALLAHCHNCGRMARGRVVLHGSSGGIAVYCRPECYWSSRARRGNLDEHAEEEGGLDACEGEEDEEQARLRNEMDVWVPLSPTPPTRVILEKKQRHINDGDEHGKVCPSEDDEEDEDAIEQKQRSLLEREGASEIPPPLPPRPEHAKHQSASQRRMQALPMPASSSSSMRRRTTSS